ncbi:threonine synthase [Litoribacter ruber]|uniref:Threonine synthase n=1 Tax=Litoribacter ruber TaxID=702568 RepID=A0AAP2G6K9_9BACT|nr:MULTISPECIES: threonine synthase [Litoribacter]MBS9525803.1 threonine synthase [Litoribacter alkaliphilus]MBT0810472.1 threonine synthase [Litoribacter ruber]
MNILHQPSTSLISHLECPKCGRTYLHQELHTVCENTNCQSSLFARYNLSPGVFKKESLRANPNSMWRYSPVLPIEKVEYMISLGEGFTPILPLQNLDGLEENRVYWKDESGNPTGSFKSRGQSTAISKALELGVKAACIPSAGNAAGALAAYCAKAGIKAHVFMPKETPQLFKDECVLYGANLTEVDGNIKDCSKLASEEGEKNGWFPVFTLKEPYRLEGKKTMGYEIAEQMDWILPDVILYPTGGGTGLLGIWKAFDEMETLGWIGSERPRMVSVQATSCDGITQAFHQHQTESEYVDKGFTIANGLRVPKPYADEYILKVLRESQGTAITINDAEMETGMKEIAKKEGLLVCPEGAALWQAFKKLKEKSWIKPGEKVLLMNTGSGYKYLENIEIN